MRSRGSLALVAALAGFLHVLPAAAGDPAPGAADVAQTEEVFNETTPDYDPWQPFNERTFAFNYRVLDRFIMKPLGRAWDQLRLCPSMALLLLPG